MNNAELARLIIVWLELGNIKQALKVAKYLFN